MNLYCAVYSTAHYNITITLALAELPVGKALQGINSCQVPIYYTWIESDNCGQNTLSKKGHTHRVGFEPRTLLLWVESTTHYTTVFPVYTRIKYQETKTYRWLSLYWLHIGKIKVDLSHAEFIECNEIFMEGTSNGFNPIVNIITHYRSQKYYCTFRNIRYTSTLFLSRKTIHSLG